MADGVLYALIGGGYVLERLARKLQPGTFVITSRRAEQVEAWRRRGWNAECFNFESQQDILQVLGAYRGLQYWIDSVPPFLGLQQNIPFLKSALEGRRIKVFYLSTTGVYGVTSGDWVTEATPVAPAHTKSELRVMAENLYKGTGLAFSAFRLSGIYGPGRGTGLSLRAGRYPLIGDGRRWTNRIHVEDIVQVLLAAITISKDRSLPEYINVSDDQPTLAIEVVSYYCNKFKLPMPSPITLEQAIAAGMFTIIGNQRVNNERIHSELGVTLKYPNYQLGAGSEFLNVGDEVE
jgi:nucleoside-diphosphate-sugar epimerase